MTETNQDESGWVDAFLAVAAEMIFIVLPLVVVAMVVIHKTGLVRPLFGSPEWSFAASILFGQAAVKMIAVAASGAVPERASLLGALSIVAGLVPSLIVLLFILNDEHGSSALTITQMVLFCAGVITYGVFGATAHYAHSHRQA